MQSTAGARLGWYIRTVNFPAKRPRHVYCEIWHSLRSLAALPRSADKKREGEEKRKCKTARRASLCSPAQSQPNGLKRIHTAVKLLDGTRVRRRVRSAETQRRACKDARAFLRACQRRPEQPKQLLRKTRQSDKRKTSLSAFCHWPLTSCAQLQTTTVARDDHTPGASLSSATS